MINMISLLFDYRKKDQVIKAKFRETLEKEMLGVRSIISDTIVKTFDLLSYQNLK